MRVVMVSKALVVGAYQRKAEEIAARGVDLTVLIPPAWGDRRGLQTAERLCTAGYTLRVIPIRCNGNFHLHYYPTLARELAALRPDVLHMDEEPYNLATFLALRAAAGLGIRATFFTWQNLYRRYPPPFGWLEQASYRRAPVAIAGSQDAATVLQRKGYRGEIVVIPQFGVDPALFYPSPAGINAAPEKSFHIGYAGGLLPEKGLDLLLRACAGLAGEWRLTLVGGGEAEAGLTALATELGIASRVTFAGRHASHEMPAFDQTLDVFVLPSRTMPNWKEQFGRVLIEAMACAVPVVGSSSGEIPHVIGATGLVFPEGDVGALRDCLACLQAEPDERRRVGQAGRERVLAQFTMGEIAERTVKVYEKLQCTLP